MRFICYINSESFLTPKLNDGSPSDKTNHDVNVMIL